MTKISNTLALTTAVAIAFMIAMTEFNIATEPYQQLSGPQLIEAAIFLAFFGALALLPNKIPPQTTIAAGMVLLLVLGRSLRSCERSKFQVVDPQR